MMSEGAQENDGDLDSLRPTNPFDPNFLKISQDFTAAFGVRKILTTVPVRKPDRHSFVRVRTGAEWRLNTCVLEVKDERTDLYLIHPTIVAAISHGVVPVALFTAMDRRGTLFLWPVRLPGSDGKQMEWHRSAFEAVKHAESAWIKVVANTSLGAYEIYEATGNLGEPEWPEGQLHDFLKMAFGDKFIDDLDHPILRWMRGEQ